MNLATLSCQGYYQILNIGVSISKNVKLLISVVSPLLCIMVIMLTVLKINI